MWLIIFYTWIKLPLNLPYSKVGKSNFFSLSVYFKSLKVLTNLVAFLCTLSVVTGCLLHVHLWAVGGIGAVERLQESSRQNVMI